MKFAWKIFFVSFIIMILLFGTGGFILINLVYRTSLDGTVQTVCDNNTYVTSSFYALVANAEAMLYDETYINYTVNNFKKQVSSESSGTKVNIGDASEMSFYNDNSFINELNENSRGWQIVSDKEKTYLQAVSRLSFNERNYYVETLTDITDIYTSRDYYCYIYQIVLIFVTLFASLILVVFSLYITRPLVKLSNISREIANGDFSKRVNTKKGYMHTKEIYQLSENFNTMSDCVEDYIELLKQEAQSRDDFVADFTHELKTPLTSVIGYADMLRSYELDAEQRRTCADYIYREGKRLEALSINLLNIIVLKNNEIKLQPISTDIIFREIIHSVKFLLEKYEVDLKVETKTAIIMVEPSMFKTMIYNIIDNACKASKTGQTVELYGLVDNDKYKIEIQDFGRGIAKEELEKITRPFYMIDKSRSRSQGGAGLGLALCKEIAKLHGSELQFSSELEKGTKVSVLMEISENKT